MTTIQKVSALAAARALSVKLYVRNKLKAIIHVHQQKIKKGEPSLIVRTYKGSKHFSKVEINGPSVLIHSEEPDRCGARVWIQAQSEDLVCDGKTYKEVLECES